MTKQEKLLLLVLACINFTHIVDFMIMMPLGPQLMRHFGIGPQAFGFIVSSYSLSAGISGFLAAFVVDRFPRNQVVLTAYAGFVVGTLACGLAPNYQMLIAARVLAGTFGGILGAQVLSIVGDVFAYERRAQAMSIVMTAFSAASVVGVPLGLYIATEYSWHAPFLAVGFLGIGVWLLIWQFVPRLDSHLVSKDQRPNPIAVLTTIIRNPNQLRALWLTTTIMLGHFSIIPYISPYLVSNVGYSESDIYLIYLVGGALTIFSAPLVGKLADRKGKFPVFVTFALLSLIPIYLITHMSPSPLVYVLFVSGMFFIFSNGRLVPTQAMTTSVVLPQNRGGFMAINSSVQLLSQALATYGAGVIIGKTATGQLTHYGTVGFLAMAAIFGSIFIARLVKPVDAAPMAKPETAPPVLVK
ncbi:MFS transporter [Persicitalea jodogahamensis]|uniref:MFS transporter n=1 Tax=Persicitalea jodogahamensis TaxID=402147 RepID=A0A8J3DAW1_9BACT|nr:MFS transporter [Persicitalea jodogahamensis]GHB70291.1 MFS transporter [Persicitalea jodogahamensis]